MKKTIKRIKPKGLERHRLVERRLARLDAVKVKSKRSGLDMIEQMEA